MDLDNLPDSVKEEMAKAEEMKAEMVSRRAQKPAVEPEAVTQAVAPEVNASAEADPAAQVVAGDAPTHPTVQTSVPTNNTETLEQHVQRLEREKAEAQKRFDTFYGSHGSDLQQLRDKISGLEQQLQSANVNPQLESTDRGIVLPGSSDPATATVAPVDQTVPSPLDNLDPALAETYGPDFIQAVSDVANAANEGQTAAMQKTVDAANARVASLESRIATEKFWVNTENVAPGAKDVNGDPSLGIKPAPGWSDFLDERIRPGSTMTRRMDAERAVQSNDSHAFGTLVKEFQLQQAEKLNVNNPQRPTVSAQAAPQSVVGNVGPSAPAGETTGRQIPQSEIDAYNARAAAGDVTIEEANLKMKEHGDALREGRVLQGV